MQDHSNRSLPVVGSIAVTALLVGGFSLWIQTGIVDDLRSQLEQPRILNEEETDVVQTVSNVGLVSIEANVSMEIPSGFTVYTVAGRTIISHSPTPLALGGEFPPPLIGISSLENPKKLPLDKYVRESDGELGFTGSEIKKVTMFKADGSVAEGVEFQSSGMYDARLLLFPKSETEIISIELGYLNADVENGSVAALEAVRATMRILN